MKRKIHMADVLAYFDGQSVTITDFIEWLNHHVATSPVPAEKMSLEVQDSTFDQVGAMWLIRDLSQNELLEHARNEAAQSRAKAYATEAQERAEYERLKAKFR